MGLRDIFGILRQSEEFLVCTWLAFICFAFCFEFFKGKVIINGIVLNLNQFLGLESRASFDDITEGSFSLIFYDVYQMMVRYFRFVGGVRIKEERVSVSIGYFFSFVVLFGFCIIYLDGFSRERMFYVSGFVVGNGVFRYYVQKELRRIDFFFRKFEMVFGVIQEV